MVLSNGQIAPPEIDHMTWPPRLLSTLRVPRKTRRAADETLGRR